MLIEIVLVLLSLVLIVLGANYLTDGASSIAARFNISQMIIGLTVVAFGTSAPELSVSIISALKGNTDIAVGNVIGSNIFNVLAILGVTAIVYPLPVGRSSRNFDIPMSVLVAILLFLVLGDVYVDGLETSTLARSEGLMLLCFGMLFLGYTIYMGKKGSQRQQEHSEPAPKQIKMPLAILFVLGGLAALIFGGQLFVSNASAIARHLGVSETLIGLTLVAWGTSMPELATSLVAALKKNTDIAIGNVVGSNIFNILFVLGFTGMVGTQSGLNFTLVDIIVQIVAPFVLFLLARVFSKGMITRTEGVIFLAIFAAYNYYIISTALQ